MWKMTKILATISLNTFITTKLIICLPNASKSRQKTYNTTLYEICQQTTYTMDTKKFVLPYKHNLLSENLQKVRL